MAIDNAKRSVQRLAFFWFRHKAQYGHEAASTTPRIPSTYNSSRSPAVTSRIAAAMESAHCTMQHSGYSCLAVS